ncbi:hypothetical protein L202_00599 [Cryptococcus amylolentus CBS 6039]|uniref:Steroid 5-alpha reductase C-terminal domain-containing protein n=1 Tax=Cryptococcus amylolentus CBS 6039 TaxID=1295533 RepID=A0A1E3I7T3_9TREE|nr:hypothetical protein L202_00599 [Cryptococcus amylolentus CBS 6039]ODN84709.1 hypothetical protein L202_00599 [Cryptococcus amylolentus CBS 6039]
MASKLFSPLISPALRFLPWVPTTLLTLPPSIALHIALHPSPSLPNFVASPVTSPLHLPLFFTLGSIPIFYFLGLVTNNISWVDRSWPLYPPVISCMIFVWALINHASLSYAGNIPRITLMFGLQLIWSTRLLSHATKRGFYDLKGQDYRYTVVQKIVPRWAFALIHFFVVAIAQPILLFALCLPLYAALVSAPLPQEQPWSIPFSAVAGLLPSRLRTAVPLETPVLAVSDYIMTAISLFIIVVEWQADKQMYAFQTGKHNLISSLPNDQLIHPSPPTSEDQPLIQKEGLPKPSPYPVSHHPGYPTRGMWRLSRHPNFAAEQLFWVSQGLFAAFTGAASGTAEQGWFMRTALGPCFALSLLFCSSTFLTEWISGRKYPSFKRYKQLVGEFLPQETALLWLWGVVRGTRGQLVKEIYEAPRPVTMARPSEQHY